MRSSVVVRALLILFAPLSAARSEDLTAALAVSKIDTRFEQAFVEAAITESPFGEYPHPEVSPPGAQQKVVWAGTDADLATDSGSLTLTFQKGGTSETFELELAFAEVMGRQRLVAKHSLLPKRSAIFDLSKAGSKRHLFGVNNDASAILLSPRDVLSDIAGTVICPRTKGGPGTLQDSGFKLAQAELHPTASIKGAFLSAGNIAKAVAELRVSPELPLSLEPTDESYGVDPKLELMYRNGDKRSQIAITNSRLDVGIAASLRFHVASGHFFTKTKTSFVHTFPVDLKTPIFMRVGSGLADIGPGYCVGLVLRSELREEYGTTPFEFRPGSVPSQQ